MKIVDYRTFVVGTAWRNITILELVTDSGLTGLGEARVVGKTHTVLEYLKDVRRHFVGHSAFDIEDLYQRFTLLDYGAPGEVVMTGLALVEMACWDLIGRRADLPVYQLIGGRVRDRVPAYANGWYTVERNPKQFATAAERVTAAGYAALKFDPFGNGNLELSRSEFHRALELIEAVDSVTRGRAQMLIEMHGRFAPHQAIEIARAIEKYEPGWIEEPCRPDDLDGHALVARSTLVPVATGERLYTANQYRELFGKRAAHVIQPDINQCGGMLETKKICSTAETHSMLVAPHNVGGAISTTAALHLMATLRNGKVLEHFNDFADPGIKRAAAPYPEVIDGHFELPRGPGWGLRLNEDFLREAEPRRKDGVILDPGLDMFQKADWNLRGQAT